MTGLPRLRSVISVLLSSAVLGALPATVTAILGHITPQQYVWSAVTGFVYASCISIPCWIVFGVSSPGFLSCRPPIRWLRMAGVLLFFAVTGCLVANVILVSVGLMPGASVWTAFRFSLRICLLVTFTGGAVSMVFASLSRELNATKQQLHEREMAAAEARYASLESRVRPHFLFNTLNSISALVRENPAEAERMVERLAALLRFSLDSELAGSVRLGEELRIVRDYLAIEQVRFGERLRFSIEADERAEQAKVPALAVQTLVENSVKYAVGAERGGAEITVRARVEDGRLRVEVGDDGPGFDTALAMKPGHGLDLLRRRLASLDGGAGSLELDGSAGAVRVRIEVPA